MFYKTRIKSVTANGAIDVNGRPLIFIGYLPVKAGDTVYTDGSVIFGNAPPKGSPAVFDEPSGIPVLGDKDLRGYFSLQGRYKKYGIKGDQWIVNSDKTFFHDNGEENIIDAEIALDDEGKETGIYTVEKSTDIEIEDDDYIWAVSDNGQDYLGINPALLEKADKDPYLFDELKMQFLICDYARLNDTDCKQTTLTIKKDNDTVGILTLRQLMADVEETAFLNVTCVDIPEFPHEDFIKSRARLINFKILPDGQWEALLDAEIVVERGFTHTCIPSTLGHLRTEATTTHNVLYPSGKRQDEYITQRQLIVTWPVDREEEHYDSTTALWRGFAHVNSNGETMILFSSVTAYPLYLMNYTRVIKEINKTYTIDITSKDDFPYISEDASGGVWSGEWWIALPHDGGYYSYEYELRNWYGQPLKTEKTFVPFHFENVSTVKTYDSRNLENMPDYDNPTIDFADQFFFPVQDDFQAKILPGYDEENENFICQFGSVLDKDNNQVVGEILPDKTDAHKWNLALAALKGGQYLFGIHKDKERDVDGALFKIDKDGKIEQVGSGLKNFRLRELKKISKAKR